MVDTGTGRKAAVMAAPKMIVPKITAAKMPIIIRSVLLEGLCSTPLREVPGVCP